MIKSHGKINLFLRITGKNKYLHNIQTNSTLLDLHDKISIKRIYKEKDIIKFKGKFARHIDNKSNSIKKTISILRNLNLLNSKIKYKITIDKKIPVFSGLGGGTSNSIFILNFFLNNKINSKIKSIFEKKIGSDINLFFFKNTFQQNMKKITKIKKNYKFYFILVKPNFDCSTKKIYSQVKTFSSPTKFVSNNFKTRGAYISFLKKQKNDLQKIVEKKHKKIVEILDLINLQKNCCFSRMTGSCSVCFGIFLNKRSATLGFKKIKKKLPHCWCVMTKTI